MVSIGPTIAIKGESAYVQSMKRIIAETKTLDTEMEKLTSSFKKGDSAIDNNKKKQELLTRQVEQLERQLLGLRDGYDKAAQKQEAASKAMADAQKKHEEAIATYGKESVEVKQARDEWDAQVKIYNQASMEMANLQSNMNLTTAEIQKMRTELKEMPNTLQMVGESMQKWGDAFSTVGDKMSMYITAPLLTAGTAAVKWASDFTDGMAKIYTIADESKKPMAEMRAELVQLSNQSGYSLEDLAEAEYQAVSASVDTAKAVDFLTDATKLARGGFTSTTQAVDLLTTVINAYGYEAEDAAYISDVLLRTQNDGKTVVDELAHSMGTVIPTAANYNVSLEQLAAAYATMTKQGVNTSRATTFLNAMFTELEKESSKISKVLDEETGKSFAQLMGEGKSLAEVLKILYDSVDQDNEEFQKLFGNIRSGKAASALLTDDFAILNYEVERMADATGQTAHAMEVLETPSLKAKRALQQLKNSGMELGSQLIDRLSPAFEKVIMAIKSGTDAFAQLDEKQMSLILGFAAFVAATGPVLSVVGKLQSSLGKFLTQLATGTLPLSTIITLVTVGIEAFAGLAVGLEIASEKHREEIQALWGLDEEMRSHIDISREMDQAYKDKLASIEQEKTATLEQTYVAQELINKYNELVDENGQVRDGHQALADVYMNQLAVALGMELSDIQALIEENGRFGESIQKTIDDIIRRAETAAYEEILTEAIKRQKQAEMELEQQEEDLVILQARVKTATNNTQKAYEDMIHAQQTGSPEIARYEQAWRDAVEAESQARASEQELRDSIYQTKVNVHEAEQNAQRAAQGIENTTNTAMRNVSSGIKTGGAQAEREARSVSSSVERGMSIDGTYNTGYNGSLGLANGIRAGAGEVSSAASYVASIASSAMNKRLLVQSPSRVTMETGKYFSEGFSLGIEARANEAQAAANMLASAALGGLAEVPPTNTYSKSISAPINIQLTIEGNVDGDDRGFARNIAGELANLIRRDNEVFA